MWNILTPLMKKKSLYDCTTGGGFAMLHPQARDHLRPGSPKPYEAVGICGPIKCGVLWHSHPKKNGPESLGFLVVPPQKKCLQNSCIKSFNPLIGPKKTVWNGPSSPFPSPGLPGVFVGVTLPETNILYPSKISYSKWNFHLPTIDPQGASC